MIYFFHNSQWILFLKGTAHSPPHYVQMVVFGMPSLIMYTFILYITSGKKNYNVFFRRPPHNKEGLYVPKEKIKIDPRPPLPPIISDCLALKKVCSLKVPYIFTTLT